MYKCKDCFKTNLKSAEENCYLEIKSENLTYLHMLITMLIQLIIVNL
jgi:hypothetical protein